MKKILAVGVAAAAFVTNANALEIDFNGSVKLKYSDVTNNRGDADSLGPVCLSPALSSYCADSDGFSTSVDFDVDVRGSSELLPAYGADINFNGEGEVDETELWAISSIGRFGMGNMKTSNKSADRISVGEGGVSTEPLGKEYHDVFGGISVSYGIQLGSVIAGVQVSEAGEPTASIQYDGDTETFEYQVFVRGGVRDEVPSPFGGDAVSSYETMQYGAMVTFGDFKFAASAGSEEGLDYSGAGGGDITRDYMNAGVAYSIGALSLSADYDTGTVNAPWAAPLNGAGATLPFPNSDRDWDAYSLGAAYKIADGLTLGAGYTVYDNVPILNLDGATVLTTTGLSLKKQSEVAASIKLAF